MRDCTITFGDARGCNGAQPFQQAITDSKAFDFDQEDIVRIRRELDILIDRLSTIYKMWRTPAMVASQKKTDDNIDIEPDNTKSMAPPAMSKKESQHVPLISSEDKPSRLINHDKSNVFSSKSNVASQMKTDDNVDIADDNTKSLAPPTTSKKELQHVPLVSSEDGKGMIEQSPPTDQYYIEETAWNKFNPPLPTKGENIPGAVASEHLQPLPPAPPIPNLPDTGKCRWSFNEDLRVLLADFIQDDGMVQLIYEDEEFLLKMMERDDISVVSNGLATGLNPELWTLKYIADTVGDEYYHKFRAFKMEVVKTETPEEKHKRTPHTAAANSSGNKNFAERPPTNGKRGKTGELSQANDYENVMEDLSERFYTIKYREMDQCLSMKIADFVRYVGMRRAVLRRMLVEQSGSVVAETDSPGEEETMFKFLDHMSVERRIDVTKVVLYMIDFDLVKLLPKLYEDLLSKFELRGCLPGGIHCMMNAVRESVCHDVVATFTSLCVCVCVCVFFFR